LTQLEVDFIVFVSRLTLLANSQRVGYKAASNRRFLISGRCYFYFTLACLKKKTASVPNSKTQARVFWNQSGL
jgi:hypothetical protein